jgi:hypothetical protein
MVSIPHDMKRFLTIVALAVGACSLSTDGTSLPTAIQPAVATITLSGTLTGTYSGLVILTGVSTTQTTWTLVGAGSLVMNGLIFLSGVPSIRSYTQADSGANASFVILTGRTPSDPAWEAGRSLGGGNDPYTLTLTGVSAAVVNSGGREYGCQGTLDITLRPIGPPGGGPVTLHATF